MANSGVLVGMAVLALLALAAFACYRQRQRQRARRVEAWVKDYLAARFGGPPGGLTINCSDDALWPVLVSFDDPRSGTRRHLQFSCSGPVSTFALLSEREEKRAGAP